MRINKVERRKKEKKEKEKEKEKVCTSLHSLSFPGHKKILFFFFG
jgi:hypothetical protein